MFCPTLAKSIQAQHLSDTRRQQEIKQLQTGLFRVFCHSDRKPAHMAGKYVACNAHTYAGRKANSLRQKPHRLQEQKLTGNESNPPPQRQKDAYVFTGSSPPALDSNASRDNTVLPCLRHGQVMRKTHKNTEPASLKICLSAALFCLIPGGNRDANPLERMDMA